MKTTKKSLWASGLSLVLCCAILVGTTFAWFTDSVGNKGNKIEAGTLSIEALAYSLAEDGTDGFTITDINGGNPFKFASIAQDLKTLSDPIISENLWEPNQSNAKLLQIGNKGTLATKIKLSFDVKDVGLQNALWFDFIQVVDGAVVGELTKRPMSTLNDVAATMDNTVLTVGESLQFILVYGMNEDAGNEYQGTTFEADVNIVAAQATAEENGFKDTQYDKKAEYPWDGVTTTPVTPQEDGTYAISNAAELAWIAQQVNNPATRSEAFSNIKLEGNIDLNGMEWTPIGGNNAFIGIFDGNGHTIKNLSATKNSGNEPTNRGVALFGYAENSTIKNLKIENCDLQGRYAVSAVVGDGCAPLTFENIEVVSGTIQANQNDSATVLGQVAGGILGQGWGPTGSEIVFKNCINRADITVNKWHAGGIWGSITASDGEKVDIISVDNCHNYGTITSAVSHAGGLGAFAYAKDCTIIASSNNGTVTAPEITSDFVARFNDQPINGNTK